MASSSPSERIRRLREEIRKHDQLYYRDASPQISDREYDRLKEELTKLESSQGELDLFSETGGDEKNTRNSPTQTVGDDRLDAFESHRHMEPMLSLDNSYSRADIEAFDQRVRDALPNEEINYVAELKIDGVALSLRYENSVLVRAATRGNGGQGEPERVPHHQQRREVEERPSLAGEQVRDMFRRVAVTGVQRPHHQRDQRREDRQ